MKLGFLCFKRFFPDLKGKIQFFSLKKLSQGIVFLGITYHFKSFGPPFERLTRLHGKKLKKIVFAQIFLNSGYRPIGKQIFFLHFFLLHFSSFKLSKATFCSWDFLKFDLELYKLPSNGHSQWNIEMLRRI